MKRVAASEFALLSIARALVGETSFLSVERHLRDERTLPAKLGPTASALLRETLGNGVVLELCRRGGWQRARHLNALGEPEKSGGRLWDRHAPPSLAFSALSMELCRWLASAPIGSAKCRPLETSAEPTLADELLLYLACDRIARTALGATLTAQSAVRRSALCWLAFPELLVAHGPCTLERDRFARFASGDGALVIEALSPELANFWSALGGHRRSLDRPRELAALGAAESVVLDNFLSSIDAAHRRDLAGFLVAAGRRLLAPGAPIKELARGMTASLDSSSSLSDRGAARRAAGAHLIALARVARWNEAHALTRHFDDGYPAAQLLLAEWEPFGAEGFRKAEAVVRELHSLDAGETL